MPSPLYPNLLQASSTPQMLRQLIEREWRQRVSSNPSSLVRKHGRGYCYSLYEPVGTIGINNLRAIQVSEQGEQSRKSLQHPPHIS